MKRIYIHGSYRGNNFGDYLLFKLAYDAVKSNNCDAVFDHVSEMYKSLNPIAQKSIMGAIVSSDAVLCAGGGFLGEPSTNNHYWNFRCLYFHMGPLFLAALMRKPIAIIGTEIGDLSSPLLKWMLRFVLKRANVISVRNDYSCAFIKNLVSNKNVEVHPDWVLTSRFSSLLSNKILNDKATHKQYFLHIMNTNENRLHIFCEGIKQFLNDYDDVDLIVGSDHDTDGHKKAVQFIIDNLPEARVSFCDYANDPNRLIETIRTCDCLVTTKLHMGICGIRLGKKVIALPCHPKIRRFYEYIHYNNEMVCDFANITSGKVYELMKYSYDTSYKYPIDDLIKDADDNEEILSRFIDRHK
jgi:polysaccharide pyruvyl transferase WcaK-like protein